MRKIHFILIAAVAVCCLASCRKDNVEDNGQGLLVKMQDRDMPKTFLFSNGEGNSMVYIPYWNDGDKVQINGATYRLNGTSTIASITKTVDGRTITLGKNALYKGIYLGDATPILPDGETSWTNEAVSVTIQLPQEQTYETFTYNNKTCPKLKAPMASYLNIGEDYNDRIDRTMIFKNTCALLDINVTNNTSINTVFVDYIEVDTVGDEEWNNKGFYGNFNLTFPTASTDPYLTYESGNNSYKNKTAIKLSCDSVTVIQGEDITGQPIKQNENNHFYIYLPPQSAKIQITIHYIFIELNQQGVATYKRKETKRRSAPYEFTANEYVPINWNLTDPPTTTK